MKSFLFTAPLLAFLLIATPAAAQEVPGFELSAGYSFTPEPSSFIDSLSDGETRHGWYASALANLNDVFGVEFLGDGSYGSTSSTSEDISIHGLMVGPRFSYRETSGIAPFGRALVGVVHRNVADTSDSYLSGQIGGGITLYTGDHFGITTGADYRRSVRGLKWDDFVVYAGFSFR